MHANAADSIRLTPDVVLAALCERVGELNGVSARELVREITHQDSEHAERVLRQVVEKLRQDGHCVCAHPASGYFMAANAAELQKTLEFLYSRALTTLRQIAAMNRVAMPPLRGQLGLPLEPKP